jgi:hypothetical protein
VPEQKKLATQEEVAEWLQVPVARLKRWRKEHRGPVYMRVGRDVRYAWSDVHRWCLATRSAGHG